MTADKVANGLGEQAFIYVRGCGCVRVQRFHMSCSCRVSATLMLCKGLHHWLAAVVGFKVMLIYHASA